MGQGAARTARDIPPAAGARLQKRLRAGHMPRPKVVLHVLRPSSGALAVHYRRITPWHAWLGPQDHAAGWPTLHTAETAALTTHVGSFRPLILQCTPLPPASVHYSCQAAPKRLAARQG